MAAKHTHSAGQREPQFNIRSGYVRERAAKLARDTGRTVTEVVEEAMRAYHPPEEVLAEGLERRGRFLVLKSTGVPTVALADILAEIAADREERLDKVGMVDADGTD